MTVEQLLAALAVPISTVVVILLGKVYDRKLAKDKLAGDHVGSWEDRLWKRVERLEEIRDRISDEKNECKAKLAILEMEIFQLRQRIEEIESRENLFYPPDVT